MLRSLDAALLGLFELFGYWFLIGFSSNFTSGLETWRVAGADISIHEKTAITTAINPHRQQSYYHDEPLLLSYVLWLRP